MGPSRRLENLALARGAEEIDASGRVVMPGFVDSHVHLAVAARRAAVQELSPRTLETLALRALEGAVRHGTTAMEAKSGLGLTDAGEMKILRVYAALRELPLTLVSDLSGDREFRPECGERLLPMLRRRKLAEFAEIRCEPGSFAMEQACRYLTHGARAGLGSED